MLHIPLAKKQPAWLLRNLRPVLLEACLKRVETKIRFRRLMHQLEARGLVQMSDVRLPSAATRSTGRDDHALAARLVGESR